MAAVLRIVGAPGSGKTLLIVSLAEALRQRGHRVATVAPRRGDTAVVVLTSGGRVTLEASPSLARLQVTIPAMDPSTKIILAEGYDAPEDATFPAVAIIARISRGNMAPTAAPASSSDSASASGMTIATLTTEDIEATFARGGPGTTDGLVDLVEQHVLGLPPREHSRPTGRGWRGALQWLWRPAGR